MNTDSLTTAAPVIDVVPTHTAELVIRPTGTVLVPHKNPTSTPDVGTTDNRRRFRRRNRRRAVIAGGGVTTFGALGAAGYALGTSALGAAIASHAMAGAAVVASATYILTRIHGHQCRCFICGG